jgi:hypothetical protein
VNESWGKTDLARLYNLKRPKSQFCSTMRAFCMIGIGDPACPAQRAWGHRMDLDCLVRVSGCSLNARAASSRPKRRGGRVAACWCCRQFVVESACWCAMCAPMHAMLALCALLPGALAAARFHSVGKYLLAIASKTVFFASAAVAYKIAVFSPQRAISAPIRSIYSISSIRRLQSK